MGQLGVMLDQPAIEDIHQSDLHKRLDLGSVGYADLIGAYVIQTHPDFHQSDYVLVHFEMMRLFAFDLAHNAVQAHRTAYVHVRVIDPAVCET